MQLTLQDIHQSFETLQAHARSRISVDLELWSQNLSKFLEHQPEIKGEVKIIDIKRGSGGSASGNIIFKAELNRGEGRKPENFVVRYSMAEGLPKQFNIQKELIKSGVPAADPLWIDETGAFFDVPAFVMEFVDAKVGLQSYFTTGPLAEAAPKDRRIMISNVIKKVAKIHAMDWEAGGLDLLYEEGKGDTLLESELNTWNSSVVDYAPDAEELLFPAYQWLKENQPVVTDPVFLHGDSNMSNYMFRGTDVVAVLDYGESHIGPRELDLGRQCNGNHLLGMGMGKVDGVPSEEEWLAEYEAISGYKVKNWDYYKTFSLFRLSIVMHFFNLGIPDDLREKTRDVSLYWQNQLFDRIRQFTL